MTAIGAADERYSLKFWPWNLAMPNSPFSPDIPPWLRILVSVSAIVAAIVVGVYVWQFHIELSQEHETWGQFGDYIGGTLNPLFAFTALLALLYTIVLQSRELRNSAEELKKSAEALEKQNIVLRKQSFEATFFALLRLYNEVVRELHITRQNSGSFDDLIVKHEGRQCLKALYNSLIVDYLHSVDRGDSLSTRRDALNSAYREFYAECGHLVGHYFRTIYIIVKFVEKAEMADVDKREYTNILRAQLSKYELGLLLYNCISDYGREKMLPLVVEYKLLKHIEDDVLLKPDDRNLAGYL